MRRWFTLAKTGDVFRIHSVHDFGGTEVLKRDLGEKSTPENLWVFLELDQGMEVPEGPLAYGATCCLIYPDRDDYVLACVYGHRPERYPRLYTTAQDDLPSVVREGSYWDQSKRLFFPPWNQLPEANRPIYAAMAASAEGTVPIEVLLKECVSKADALMLRGDEPVPGGSRN